MTDLYFESIMNLAKQDDMDAQCLLGKIYGNEGNTAETVKWFTLAAENGHIDAQYRLGEIYEYGKGVNQDDIKAAKWFKRSIRC